MGVVVIDPLLLEVFHHKVVLLILEVHPLDIQMMIDVSGYHVIPGSTLVLLDVLPMSGIIDCRACFCLNFELLVSVGLVFLSVRCIVINMGQIGNLCTS